MSSRYVSAWRSSNDFVPGTGSRRREGPEDDAAPLLAAADRATGSGAVKPRSPMTSPYSSHRSPPLEDSRCRSGAAACIAARDACIQGWAAASDHGSALPRAAFFGAMRTDAEGRRAGGKMLPQHNDTASEQRENEHAEQNIKGGNFMRTSDTELSIPNETE